MTVETEVCMRKERSSAAHHLTSHLSSSPNSLYRLKMSDSSRQQSDYQHKIKHRYIILLF